VVKTSGRFQQPYDYTKVEYFSFCILTYEFFTTYFNYGALVAFGLAHFLTGIHVDTFWTALVFALILAVLNVLVKPILIILTLPLTIITLGLFLFVVNALVVLLASRFVRGFSIDNFWWGLVFALLLALITSVVFKELDKEKKKRIF
jgi:putative membrane protein